MYAIRSYYGLLESSGASAQGNGLSLYVSTIPFILYGWVAVILVPLVCLGAIPNLGAMKTAEMRVLVRSNNSVAQSYNFV